MDDQRKDHTDQKDPCKGITPNNFRLIICLPMMWKILTTQIREEIYYLFTSHRLDAAKDPEAQENYSTLISTSSTRARQDGKNLAMAWIDYKEAYDIVP